MKLKPNRGDEGNFEYSGATGTAWVCQWEKCERPAMYGLKKFLPIYRESPEGLEVESYRFGDLALFCEAHMGEAKREWERELDVRVQVVLKQ